MITLRPYQAECVEAVYRHFEEHNSVLGVLATGLGKTVIGSAVIGEWLRLDSRGRVLWIAHREELIDQAADAIRRLTGAPVAIEMGDRYSDEGGFMTAPVVLASVQTLSRLRRLKRFRPDRFGLIVTDEAHHAVAASYRKIYRYFREGSAALEIAGNPSIRHLGITATPRRADDLAMGQEFNAVAYEYGIEPAVKDGWLVPVRQAIVIVDDLDLSKVKVIGGDYQADQLEAILTQRKVLLEMAGPAIDEAGRKPALFFCVGVHQSELMCEVLNDARPGSAAWVSGETPKEQRKKVIEDFRAGRLQFLCNCGVFLEGFDAPATSLVVMARPTKSLPLYVQMLGRATRPLPGTVEGIETAEGRKLAILQSAKPWATVLDFVGNAKRHAQQATVTAADVLGGNYGDDAKEYARKRIEEADGARPIEEELDRADAELALLREEEEMKARIVAEVDYRVRYLDVDAPPPDRVQDMTRFTPATEKQIRMLLWLGVRRATAEAYSKRQASAVIDKLLERRKA